MEWGEGERIRYYKFYSHKHSFPFFCYHKSNLHLGITISVQLLFFCFLKYESFSNCQQSYYKNIGYFEWSYTCENLTFHLQTEKRCNICEWDGVLTLFINSMKIAIIIYRCINNSAGMILTNEIGVPIKCETKRNETKRNQRKWNETKRNQRNGNEMKRNQRKQNEID